MRCPRHLPPSSVPLPVTAMVLPPRVPAKRAPRTRIGGELFIVVRKGRKQGRVIGRDQATAMRKVQAHARGHREGAPSGSDPARRVTVPPPCRWQVSSARWMAAGGGNRGVTVCRGIEENLHLKRGMGNQNEKTKKEDQRPNERPANQGKRPPGANGRPLGKGPVGKDSPSDGVAAARSAREHRDPRVPRRSKVRGWRQSESKRWLTHSHRRLRRPRRGIARDR